MTGTDKGSEGKVSGGVAPLGHGKREGPAGDKFPRSGDAGNGGRVRRARSDRSPLGVLLRGAAKLRIFAKCRF